jgi:hypothetical protein
LQIPHTIDVNEYHAHTPQQLFKFLTRSVVSDPVNSIRIPGVKTAVNRTEHP